MCVNMCANAYILQYKQTKAVFFARASNKGTGGQNVDLYASVSVCHACERVMKVALAGSCMNPAEVCRSSVAGKDPLNLQNAP